MRKKLSSLLAFVLIFSIVLPIRIQTASADTGDTVVNFNSFTDRGQKISGNINGIDFGISAPQWYTAAYDKYSDLWAVIGEYTNNQAEKTITLPAGKVLKSLEIGNRYTASTVVLSSPGTNNPDVTTTLNKGDLLGNIVQTNWKIASPNVLIKVIYDSGTGHFPSETYFHEFTYGDVPAWYAKTSFADGTFNLGADHTGIQTAEFDITPLTTTANIDALVGYGGTATDMSGGYGNFAMILGLSGGSFNVRNGGGYSKLATINYVVDNKYHVRMVTNLLAKVYDVYITPPGGIETMIAQNYAFRTGAPVPYDLGQVCVYSDTGANDVFKLENHRVTTTVALNGISLVSSGSYEINAGLTLDMKATTVVTAHLANGDNYDVTAASTFTSQTPDLATVTPSGIVTSLKHGTAKIAVTYANQTATADVIIDPPLLTGIKLDSNIYSVIPGHTRPIVVTASYTDGSLADVTSSASFESSQTGVATVDAVGVITGVAEGDTVITATYGGKTATAIVMVQPLTLTGIKLDLNEYSLIKGNTHNTIVMAVYSDGSEKNVTSDAGYALSITGIVFVDKGKITGLANGNVVITVTFENKEATVNVTVEEAGPDPVIYFSDLVSGPRTGNTDTSLGQSSGVDGAIVTVWGKNLGSSQGTSQILVGGVPARIYSWGKATAPADLYSKLGMQMVAFQIPSGAPGGATTIQATINGSPTNTLPFTIRAGNIYFVKTTGNDTTGTGSWSSPWQTLANAGSNGAVSKLNPGDTLYMGDGVKQTCLCGDRSTMNLEYGMPSSRLSTQAMPKALIAYPGASVSIGSNAYASAWSDYVGSGTTNFDGISMYWVISKLNLTGQQTGASLGSGFRLIGSKITAPMGDQPTGAVTGVGNDLYLFGNEVTNTGYAGTSKLYHPIYIQSTESSTTPRLPTESNRELGWNYLHDNYAFDGINIYREGSYSAYMTNHRIHDNYIINQTGRGMLLGDYMTGENWVYNNVILQSGRGPIPNNGDTAWAYVCMDIQAGAPGAGALMHVYNNTLNDCSSVTGNPANTTGMIAVEQFYDPYIVDFRNNIVQTTGSGTPYIYGGTIPAGVTMSGNKNIWFGNGSAPNFDIAPIITDPKLVNPAAGDAHLQSSSPAIDSAAVPSGYPIPSRDMDGVVRPIGAGYDIGAYESNVVKLLSQITLVPTATTLDINGFQQIAATAVYSNGIEEDITNTAAYESSNTSVAEVSAAGMLTGISQGSAEITVSYNGKTAVISVNVTSKVITLTKIGLDSYSYELNPGRKHQTVATAYYSDGKTKDITANTAYTSSNPNIGIVGTDGIVTGVDDGVTRITATYEGKASVAEVTVRSFSINSVEFEDLNGNSVASLTGLDFIKVIAQITNNTALTQAASFHVVLFDSRNAVKQLTYVSSVVGPGESAGYGAGFILPENTKGYYIKVFVQSADGKKTISNTLLFPSTYLTPTAPAAANIAISGNANAAQTLTGSYQYLDANGDHESGTTFKWLRSNSLNGQYTEIRGAKSQNYTLTQADVGKYIKFQVTPRTTVAPRTGEPMMSAALGPVGDGGMVPSIQSIRHLIDGFVASGDLKDPLTDQLRVRLSQAEQHLSSEGSLKKAAKDMEDFLNDLDKKSLQSKVSASAKQTLSENAQALIQLWTE